MKKALLILVALLSVATIADAGNSTRVFTLVCDPEVQGSRARIWIRANSLSFPILALCGESFPVTFLQGDVARLVVRVRHPRLGLRRCVQAMPDWFGENECGLEGMNAKATVR